MKIIINIQSISHGKNAFNEENYPSTFEIQSLQFRNYDLMRTGRDRIILIFKTLRNK